VTKGEFTLKKIDLTSSEIGMLWTQYVQNSMTVQILSYLLATVEDEEIKAVVTYALEIARDVTSDTKSFFKEEGLPIPKGFTEEDVEVNAPKLFLDPFILMFLESIGKAGAAAHAVSLAVSSRKDVRDLFTKSATNTMKLYNMSVDTGLAKGLYVRPPQIDVQDEVEYVEGKKYFSPFNKRVLNTVELIHLFENIKTNSIGEMICTGFAQTTKSKKIQSYMERGKQISRKHSKVFADILMDSDIRPPMPSSGCVTNSTSPVFSDRLMMFFKSVLSAAGQGNYSTASTASMRYDLVLNYQRLSVEIALYAQDGADILMKNGWLEEPPQALDRKELRKKS
jgi:Protein of unknown function (DUF3231)